jgi:hypothetical protein
MAAKLKLKGIDFKKLAINHGEKAAVGIVAILVVLSLLGTKWIPYGHVPREITESVAKAKQNIAGRTWPDDEKQKFLVPPEESVEELVANNIHRRVDVSPFEFELPFRFGLYETTKPITEPVIQPVADLIADPWRIVMDAQPLPPETLLEEETPDESSTEEMEVASEDEDIPEEFRSREGLVPSAGLGLAGTPGIGYGGSYGGAGAYGDTMSDAAGLYGGSDYGFEYSMDGGYGGSYGEGYGPAGTGGALAPVSNARGRGLRLVAIRGIFPLREQLAEFKKSCNLSTFAQVGQLFEIINFELQRKKAVHGPDPWAGDWEDVDIEVAIEVLQDARLFDPEVVEGSVTDSVITMPLPGLVMGVWKSRATHPKLDNFTLSEEEIQQEVEFNRRLAEKWTEQRKNQPEAPVQKGGFANVAGSSRQLALDMGFVEYGSYDGGYGGAYGGEGYSDASGGGGAYAAAMAGAAGVGSRTPMQMTKEAEDFLKELEKETTKEEKDKKLLEYIKERITAQGELLLFRYFDFDVEPGAVYKYRVRVEIKNPNYGRKSSEANGLAHVVEGQTRTSEWSNETQPVRVQDDVDYFMTDLVDARGRSLPEAKLAVFQWDPEIGTTVSANFGVEFGKEIGGPLSTHVLDPAKRQFEIEPYTFQTGDVLADGFGWLSIPKDQHPDLNLPKFAKTRVPISGQMLVVRGDGSLTVFDQKSRVNDLVNRKKYLDLEQEPFADIKSQEAEARRDQAKTNDLGLYGDLYGGGGGYGGGAYGGEAGSDYAAAMQQGYGVDYQAAGASRGGANPLRKRAVRSPRR